MEQDKIHYLGSEWVPNQDKYNTYMCVGPRSRGKTTFWVDYCTQRALKYEREEGPNHRHKFIFIRRQEKQLQLVLQNGLYNFKANYHGELYEGLKDSYYRGEIILTDEEKNKHVVGRYYDLNTIKGISNEDCDIMIFDEYIEQKRADYKRTDDGKTEPILFAKLVQTLFRDRKFWIIMLANEDTYTNPYHEYFHIPFGAEKCRNKARGIWFEKDIPSAEFLEFNKRTTIGRLFGGTEYYEYAIGKSSLSKIGEDFIAEKPTHAKRLCNLRIMGQNLTMWVDDVNAIEYVSNKYKFDKHFATFSVTRDDMSINSEFVDYNPIFIANQRIYYAQGRVRFSDQSVAELFYLIIKLL